MAGNEVRGKRLLSLPQVYPSSAQCVVLGAIVVGFVVLVVVEITSLP